MPIMSGFTHDEYNFQIAINQYFSTPPQAPVSESDVRKYVETTYGTDASKVLAAYNPSSYATPQLGLDAIGTASIACPQQGINQALSSQVPLYTPMSSTTKPRRPIFRNCPASSRSHTTRPTSNTYSPRGTAARWEYRAH
jgi:hypothetical protein